MRHLQPKNDEQKKIIDLLAELYGWPVGAYWLMWSNELLDGSRPDYLIIEGHEDRVLQVLEQLADGAYI